MPFFNQIKLNLSRKLYALTFGLWKTADAWHASQNRTFRSNLWTSRTLKICEYHNPWVNKPVLCSFLNHWIYFWIVVWVFRAQLGQLGLICVWLVGSCFSVEEIDDWAMPVSTILTLDRIDFDAIFQQINLNISRKLYALTFGLWVTLLSVEKTPLPSSFPFLFYPQRTFGNPLRAVFSNIELFPATANFPTNFPANFPLNIRGDF